MSGGRILPLAAALLAGLGGAGVALLLAERGGGGERTVTVSAVTADPSSGSSGPTATVVRSAGRGFDPAAIYDAASAGVVTISARVGGETVDGSGFVVSADGHVLTNAHVVTDSPDHDPADAGAVKAGHDFFVHFQDGNSVPAELVGYDLFDDIAILKVDPAREPLTVLRFGRARALHVGDPLAVIGSPFGEEQEQSLSVGVVSALNREIDAPATDFTTPGVIQTDAAINHGNSGGPVLDAAGRVVGVAAQILTDGTADAWTGIGFAVPAEAAQRSFRELVAHRRVRYAWLGVATHPINRELARTFGLPVDHGLLVNGVTPGGPSAKAGLSAGSRTADFQDDGPLHPDGDVIVAFDGEPVRIPPELSTLVALAEPGSKVPVEIVRDGKRRTIEVTLGNRPARLPG